MSKERKATKMKREGKLTLDVCLLTPAQVRFTKMPSFFFESLLPNRGEVGGTVSLCSVCIVACA
jgi:hypothetical protein